MLKPKKKTAKRKSTKKVAKRRNPDTTIRDIEDYLEEEMKKNPNAYPPAVAIRAIKKFKLDIGDGDLEDNWVTDFAYQIGDKIIYDRGKSRARKVKKGSRIGGYIGIGNYKR